ncbi:MAG: NAD-dependent epimerase/dehydratase family protein, partial [Caulobacteraceae bacterium]
MSEQARGPALITGGAGFFGGLLARRLLEAGRECVILDVRDPDFIHPRLTALRGDIGDPTFVSEAFEEYRPETVHHCAAMLAHAVADKSFLWQSNVEGTHNVVASAADWGARSLVFISSNCLWADNKHRPVREDDAPAPVEIYGRSKWAAEQILDRYRDKLNVITIRSPTIVEEGRLGLLAILFEFIDEGRKVW